MSVDKFGRYSIKNHCNNELTLDFDSNSLNAHFKRIRNIKDPLFNGDAATKNFVIKTNDEYQNLIQISIEDFKNSIETKFNNLNSKIESLEGSLHAILSEVSWMNIFKKSIDNRVFRLESIHNLEMDMAIANYNKKNESDAHSK